MTEPTSISDAPPKCPTCRGPLRQDEARVCGRCEIETERMLGELVELHALASGALTPPVSGEPGALGAHLEPPVPLSLDALDLAVGEVLLSTDLDVEDPPWSGLEAWERDWRRQFRLTHYGPASARRHGGTLVGVVGFLRAWWPRACVVDPSADDFVRDVRRMHGQALAALALTRADLDPTQEDPYDYFVDCPGITKDGLACGHRIGMRRQPRPLPKHPPKPVWVWCPKCGWHGTGEWLITVAIDAGADVTMSLEEASVHFGVTAGTIRKMAARGELIKIHGRYTVNTERA